jgi:hypothetical protein
LRVYVGVVGSKPNLEDSARNLIEDRRRALLGKEKSMYIGIGTIVIIIIIVLVVLMLRRRLCFAGVPAVFIRRHADRTDPEARLRPGPPCEFLRPGTGRRSNDRRI